MRANATEFCIYANSFSDAKLCLVRLSKTALSSVEKYTAAVS